MKRVAIVGDSGSGKTWLGARLAQRLDCQHVELDALYWQPDWEPLDSERFRDQIAAITATERWVIDGNYGSLVQPIVLGAADTAVWLDLPRRQIMTAVTRRTLVRVLGRRRLWNGNRERLRNLLRWEPEENIIRWAWVQHASHRRRYGDLMANATYPHLTWVRLGSRSEVSRWLAARD